MTTIDPSKDIVRADLLERIKNELPGGAIPDDNIHDDPDKGGNATTVLHANNLQKYRTVTSASWTYGIDTARLGNGELYVQDFISLNKNITDNDITDTIVSTALRCTQVRRARYKRINGSSESEETHLFHLDIAAQQWYEEFNQLGRKYSLEAGRDIVKTGVIGNDPDPLSNQYGGLSDEGLLDPTSIKGALELVSRVLKFHRNNATVLDVSICHGDCHSNCHSNRSRR